VLVLGDVMLDQFIWGNVFAHLARSAVPVVDSKRESFMPGGRGVRLARNLTALNVQRNSSARLEMIAAAQLKKLLVEQKIGCAGLIANAASTRASRHASLRTSSKSVRI